MSTELTLIPIPPFASLATWHLSEPQFPLSETRGSSIMCPLSPRRVFSSLGPPVPSGEHWLTFPAHCEPCLSLSCRGLFMKRQNTFATVFSTKIALHALSPSMMESGDPPSSSFSLPGSCGRPRAFQASEVLSGKQRQILKERVT